jgi:regulator of protease activity HflC (stomatin/prohibitin superfamily)
MAAAQKMVDGDEKGDKKTDFNVMSDVISPAVTIMCFPIVCCCSWKQVNEREEAVVLQWGRYQKTIKEPGIRWVNCCGTEARTVSTSVRSVDVPQQKMVDGNGNPLLVSAVLVYQVENSFRAAIGVADYNQFVLQQGQAVLKQVVSQHPYEDPNGGESLRNEAKKIGSQLVETLQAKVNIAGIKIFSYEFNELSYAPEIASQMLKRQQAHALVQARSTIVQGAVETAHGAISAMEAKGFGFSKEGKERLVSSLLTVMCSESDVHPTVSV